MKLSRFIALFAILAIFLTGCGSAAKEAAAKAAAEQTYRTNFGKAIALLQVHQIGALAVTAQTSAAWDESIKDRACCDDWQEKLQKRRAGMASAIELVKKGKDGVDAAMREIANPPEKYKGGYDVLMEQYMGYGELARQALEPTGSLLTYNQAVNKASERFQQLTDKLLVTLPPDFKKEEPKK